jgi:pyruvate kinase
MFRKAKIVATLGPASQEEAILRKMIEAGLDVARLNFSHGTHQNHAELIKKIRKLSIELNKPVTILQDLQGPKLRVGVLPEGGIELEAGQQIVLAETTEHIPPTSLDVDKIVIPMEVPNLTQSVEKGHFILMDDGHLELEVTAVHQDAVEAEVLLGGRLTSNKGVNLPGAKIDIPGFTNKDREDLEFGLEHDIDALAISFVKNEADIDVVRKAIREIKPGSEYLPIIAKMELPESIENMESIIKAADGIMVARGDLAVETSLASVPIVQKRMIDSANRNNRIVITATQMLESMIRNPRPTRAEASDVANAVLDGTDAVMLSAESAVGRFPVQSILVMDHIVKEAEMHYKEWGSKSKSNHDPSSNDAITTTRAAHEMSLDQNVASIAVFTKSGRTALYMSKTRPDVPILAFTPQASTFNRLGLYWGITPYLVPFANSIEEMLSHVEDTILKTTSLMPGQQVVLVSSFPVASGINPNIAMLHTVKSR